MSTGKYRFNSAIFYAHGFIDPFNESTIQFVNNHTENLADLRNKTLFDCFDHLFIHIAH